MNLSNIFIYASIFLVFITTLSCNSYNLRRDLTPDQRFEIAKRMFKNKDYFEAKSQFKIVTLNNPGASYVDEAQFLLGECHFNMKEYVLAADEFGRLRRLYPRSQWVDDAQYKIALCNFRLSPKPALDQTYTVKAVASFQQFIDEFPESELVGKAERLMKVCRQKLAEKDFKAGELYRKLGDHYGALVYFRSVIESYYDTKFLEPATYWKAESLFNLGRNEEARFAFEELLRKFPKTTFDQKAKMRLEEIEEASASLEQSSNGVSQTN